MKRPCIEPGCPIATTRTRCQEHERERERQRASTAQRGYGWRHQMRRRLMESMLPAPCGYCGGVIGPGERWDAAHVVDGEPSAGYVIAHPRCNQRAKGRGAVGFFR